jgi:hypothetical protein
MARASGELWLTVAVISSQIGSEQECRDDARKIIGVIRTVEPEGEEEL